VLLHVDGAQVPRGELYQKFLARFRRVSTVESWQQRIVSRLSTEDRGGFAKLRGRVATNYVFAKVFAGDDRGAYDTARNYAEHLEGKFGNLWRLGLTFGRPGWWALCRIVRLRTRIQYYLRDRSREGE